ncbi:TetR/AcrR family transcriptional regulator [Actinocatenispora rupis]|uniref:TetR family transcriptional regulator n=1 Tax=Actinocatenispora rupis TaxID=519421 RepID=A0A8J3J772_9ACTN|nr:TetR/AcrR family transcriptional regulator [Actinocatenispora rupis]GID11334.1 TetR family transcriptional regulator [Actinocatenispora rupis]
MTPRADATRNRARVLDSAHAVFAEHGLGASTEQIARHAGVGVGTVFRHFPTKEALLSAVLAARLDALADEAETLAAQGESGDGLYRLMRSAVAASSLKTAFAEALQRAGVDVSDAVAPARGRLTNTVGTLLDQAQRAGTARTDIEVRQVFALLVAATHAVTYLDDDPLRERTLDLILSALRP